MPIDSLFFSPFKKLNRCKKYVSIKTVYVVVFLQLTANTCVFFPSHTSWRRSCVGSCPRIRPSTASRGCPPTRAQAVCLAPWITLRSLPHSTGRAICDAELLYHSSHQNAIKAEVTVCFLETLTSFIKLREREGKKKVFHSSVIASNITRLK